MTNSYSYAIIRVWKSNIQQEGGIRNMDSVANEVITRKATAEEIERFQKLIQNDRNWYSCDNCAAFGHCEYGYTNKWCPHFKFSEEEED